MDRQLIQEQDGELWTVEGHPDIKLSYKIKRVLAEHQSPIQHIMIADTAEFGPVLVLDGVVQSTSKDGFIYNEMITHVPLLSHPNPRNVLIIGGGDCGAAREAAKYPNLERIDMVEIDEMVVRLCLEHLPEVSGGLSDPRVNFIFDDGVEYIKRHRNEYDVVIIDCSDPIGPATKLFTYKFYQNAFLALKEDGVFSCQSESPIYFSHVMRGTYVKLAKLFQETRLYHSVIPTYPGGLWTFAYASKAYAPLAGGTSKWKEYGLGTKFVNEGILRACFHLPEFIKQELEALGSE